MGQIEADNPFHLNTKNAVIMPNPNIFKKIRLYSIGYRIKQPICYYQYLHALNSYTIKDCQKVTIFRHS